MRQEQEVSNYGDECYGWLSNLRQIIIDGLKIDDAKVKAKYEWLKSYFIEVVTDDDAYYPVLQDESYNGKLNFRKIYHDLEIG